MEKRELSSIWEYLQQKHSHFASKCRTTDTQIKRIHSVTETDEEYQEILSFHSDGWGNTQGKRLYATMLLGERPVRFQLDCG